jgi:isopenicillin N synthase-like dioxygenase
LTWDATVLALNDIVYEKTTNEWLDVVPTKGAYVVNLGNMFMRWSNDKYISNLHRVINKSGKERYSVPFFYSVSENKNAQKHLLTRLPGQSGLYHLL